MTTKQGDHPVTAGIKNKHSWIPVLALNKWCYQSGDRTHSTHHQQRFPGMPVELQKLCSTTFRSGDGRRLSMQFEAVQQWLAGRGQTECQGRWS